MQLPHRSSHWLDRVEVFGWRLARAVVPYVLVMFGVAMAMKLVTEPWGTHGVLLTVSALLLRAVWSRQS